MSNIKKEKERISGRGVRSAMIPIISISIILCGLSGALSFSPRPNTAYIAQADVSEYDPQAADRSPYSQSAGTVDDYLKAASTYYQNGRYGEAIEYWNNVLALDPVNRGAKEGIESAEKKIAKVNEFFGRDVFELNEDISKLSLRNCLDIAEERSMLFQIAKEQIGLAKIKVWEARRSFLPSLTLSWTRTGGKRDGKLEGVEYGVEGRQPAFHSGELIHTLGQSKTNLKIAEKNYDQVKIELDFAVAEVYYTFVKAKKFRAYIKELYENIKPLYRMANDKHENGVVSDIEYLGAESKFNQLYYSSITADNDYDLARLSLEQAMNMKDIGVIDIEEVFEQKVVDKDMDVCLALAMENRPDLKMSEFTVKSTDYGKKIAEARSLPKIDLSGYYKKASEVTEPGDLDPQKKWYAGVEAVWPFYGSTGTYSMYKKEDTSTVSSYFSGAMSKGRTLQFGVLDNIKQFSEKQEAEIANARAKEELNGTRKKVIMEVKEAYYGYERTRIQLEAAKAQKTYREKESKIIEAKHSAGDAELSEVFDSMLGIAEAIKVYLEAEMELSISIAALNRAIGLEDYF